MLGPLELGDGLVPPHPATDNANARTQPSKTYFVHFMMVSLSLSFVDALGEFQVRPESSNSLFIVHVNPM